jgi:hypothetical protein
MSALSVSGINIEYASPGFVGMAISMSLVITAALVKHSFAVWAVCRVCTGVNAACEV